MPEPEDQDVNAAENPSPAEQEPVNPPTEEQPSAEDTTPQEPEPAQAPASQTVLDVDEQGTPWKNRAIEAERKFSDVPHIIRQTVEELTKANTPAQPEYTIDQLEKYALENPQYRPWVENEKAKIITRNLEKSLDAKLEANKKVQSDEIVRQQSEAWVTQHPKFKDCFTKDAAGRTVWNYQNPLTPIIGNYLQQTDPTTGRPVKERPDGLLVAAKLAYADHALTVEPAQAGKVNQLKRDLRKAQKSQITPPGTPSSSAPARSEVKKALETYNKTYNKSNIHNAVKAFLIADGKIKED